MVERLAETHVGGTSDLEIHGAETRGTGINTKGTYGKGKHSEEDTCWRDT